MKLFKSLLVAPATLGLLAPMSASANEVTINDFNAAEEIAVSDQRDPAPVDMTPWEHAKNASYAIMGTTVGIYLCLTWAAS